MSRRTPPRGAPSVRVDRRPIVKARWKSGDAASLPPGVKRLSYRVSPLETRPTTLFAEWYRSNNDAQGVVRNGSKAQVPVLGIPVARTKPKILDSLDDDEINALTVEIKNANPWMTDADLIRAIANSAEERRGRKAVRANVRHATREGARVPQPDDTLSAERDGALEAINEMAAELRRVDPGLTEAGAFSKAYLAPENRTLAKAERLAARAALS